MLIGEAPGAQETEQRRPFVGKAGQNLNEFLQAFGLARGQMYVGNTVKIRPSKISAAGRIVNRPPTRDEIEFFLPFLLEEIEIAAPKCIITLGNTPLQALTDRKTVIGDVHGRFMECRGRLLFPMYHPASMIYNRSLREIYAQDLEKLVDWYRNNEKITEMS